MRPKTKGFIEIGGLLLIGAIAIAGIIGGFVGSKFNKAPQLTRFGSQWNLPEELRKLGASVTPRFPTSTNVFAEGDVIEEEDWNQLEIWMGTRNSTDTLSINYRLASSSSLDPGHVHRLNNTTSSVTSTLGIVSGGTGLTTSSARGRLIISTGTGFETTSTVPTGSGGTATTTYSGYGVVVASTSAPFDIVAPGTSGNVLTSIGSTWVSSGSVATVSKITLLAFASGTIADGAAVYMFADSSMTATSTGNAGARIDTCDVNVPCKTAQSFSIVTTSTVSRVAFFADKNGAPDDLIVGIRANSSTEPATPYLASSSVASSSFSGNRERITAVFNTSTILSPRTTYWIVWEVIAGTGAGNHYEIHGEDADRYKRGESLGHNGTSWANSSTSLQVNDIHFDLALEYNAVDTADADTTQTATSTIGIASSAMTQGASSSITIVGTEEVISDTLFPGGLFYLSNDAGRLSITAGTILRKIGIGINSSTILLTPQW